MTAITPKPFVGAAPSGRTRLIRRIIKRPIGALSLGFLGDADGVAIYETGPWTRLTTQRGHVLIKRKAWTLAR